MGKKFSDTRKLSGSTEKNTYFLVLKQVLLKGLSPFLQGPVCMPPMAKGPDRRADCLLLPAPSPPFSRGEGQHTEPRQVQPGQQNHSVRALQDFGLVAAGRGQV